MVFNEFLRQKINNVQRLKQNFICTDAQLLLVPGPRLSFALSRKLILFLIPCNINAQLTFDNMKIS